MESYKCLIVDDNVIDRAALEMYLGKIPQAQIVAVCKDGMEAREVLMTQDIDLVFSDVDMPELSGTALLKSLRISPVFIFISSHPEYAVESYELDVIDFIVKPVTFERLLKSFNKATEYLQMQKTGNVATAAVVDANEQYFFIKESNDYVKLFFRDVTFIESMGDFSKIYTIDDRKHITLVGLKNLESQLPASSFTRVHKQYIVNHDHISTISSDELTVAGKHKISLSQSFRQGLLDKVVNKRVITRHPPKDPAQ